MMAANSWKLPMNITARILALTDSDVATAVRNRLPLSDLTELREAGLKEAEIDALVIPQRTRRHRALKGEPLTVEESDKVMRITRILAHAAEVFGDADRAMKWLRKPLRELGGETPLMMSDTEAGGRVVENILAQIAWGAAA
jgi:putative toxin-antitoxin system antitoxin component (TIGR02293 family)